MTFILIAVRYECFNDDHDIFGNVSTGRYVIHRDIISAAVLIDKWKRFDIISRSSVKMARSNLYPSESSTSSCFVSSSFAKKKWWAEKAFIQKSRSFIVCFLFFFHPQILSRRLLNLIFMIKFLRNRACRYVSWTAIISTCMSWSVSVVCCCFLLFPDDVSSNNLQRDVSQLKWYIILDIKLSWSCFPSISEHLISLWYISMLSKNVLLPLSVSSMSWFSLSMSLNCRGLWTKIKKDVFVRQEYQNWW